jgi:uncharacterized membrane protein
MRIPKDFQPSYLQSRKVKNPQKFWLSIFGILFLLVVLVWLIGCASNQQIGKSLYEIYGK